jgi:anion-transporting  ArsA/GET3 family ATPase
VLDTPPTRNALDFLDAPRRLSSFIDSRSLQLFTAPGFFGLKVLGRGTGVVFSVMKRLTGIDLLEDLSEFFRSFGDMSQGFRERAERVNALLADSRTAFLLVTSPRRDAIAESGYFHHRLLDSGMPFAGAVVNRVQPPTEAGAAADLEELLGDPLARKVERNLEDYRRLAERDRANLAELRKRLGRKPMIQVPQLDEEVHDLAGLARMNEHLFDRAA